jgi:hypothetical protein
MPEICDERGGGGDSTSDHLSKVDENFVNYGGYAQRGYCLSKRCAKKPANHYLTSSGCPSLITQIINPIICIVIENKNIVNMHREQFDIIWESIQQ